MDSDQGQFTSDFCVIHGSCSATSGENRLWCLQHCGSIQCCLGGYSWSGAFRKTNWLPFHPAVIRSEDATWSIRTFMCTAHVGYLRAMTLRWSSANSAYSGSASSVWSWPLDLTAGFVCSATWLETDCYMTTDYVKALYYICISAGSY